MTPPPRHGLGVQTRELFLGRTAERGNPHPPGNATHPPIRSSPRVGNGASSLMAASQAPRAAAGPLPSTQPPRIGRKF